MRFNFLKKIIILLAMLCVVSVNAYSKSFSLRINNPNSNVELNTNMNHENMNHKNMNHKNMSKACADCKKGACLSTNCSNCSKCQSCTSLNIIPQYIATSIYESLNQSKLTFNAIKIKPIHYSIYIPPE